LKEFVVLVKSRGFSSRNALLQEPAVKNIIKTNIFSEFFITIELERNI
jgi:hypothetical protein